MATPLKTIANFMWGGGRGVMRMIVVHRFDKCVALARTDFLIVAVLS